MSNGSYPVRVDLRAPTQVANWRPLVHWLLVIPHLLVVYGLRVLRTVLTIIGFFVVLFTGKYPQALRSFVVGVQRWSLPVGAYVLFLRDEYPPFSLEDGEAAPIVAVPPPPPPSG
jgi:hypothetical protein